jgi:uncharacterized RDD family membrane protein YckC
MQQFWGIRLVALIIDAVFITLLLWVLSALVYPLVASTGYFGVLNYWYILWGIVIWLYFTVMEGRWSSTLGKGLFKLKVQAKEGEMSYKKAFIRNISKFLWIPLVVDVAIGFASGQETKERYLDRVAGTMVIKTE